MAVQWTKEQRQVIDTRNKNILVSAAAGSGKTAVLVERILARITDPKNPVDIDRLLIVTFTKAAAGEMKERIRAAIEKRLLEDEENEHLQRQSTLVHHAQITTIDSFCSYVVRNYFHKIDLDPSFRMMEEGEIRMMQDDVLDKVLEGAYAQKDEAYEQFVERYASGKTDEGIAELILRLYGFSQSYPYPVEWLESCRHAYNVENPQEMEETVWMRELKEEIQKELEEAYLLAKEACKICAGEDGPMFYGEALESDAIQVQKILEADSFDEKQKLFDKLSYVALSRKKDPNASEEKKELVKSLRQQMKDLLDDLKEQYFQVPMETAFVYMKEAGKSVSVLVNLAIRFTEAYAEKKREKNQFDFSDLEHYALQILVEHTEDGDERSDAAKELSQRFEEIMIDEYQDSNYVQEKLLTAVSRLEDGIHNVFMVGDVKQSIYRFRLARPELFMEKFHEYPLLDEADNAKNCRIDLHKNFRSRKEVLDGVNFLFYQIMRKELGDITYDAEAALYPGADFPENEAIDAKTEVLLLETDEVDWKDMESGENAQELEARLAAIQIEQMVGNYPVLDKKTGEYRPAKYADFAILLRTMSGWSENFKKILNARGIPASVTTKTGYFSASEVRETLDYLRILDNPLQDIPFSGALHSFMGNFSMEELAKIKCIGKEAGKESMYEAFLEAQKQENGSGKLTDFYEIFKEMRQKVPYTPIHELLWEIFDKTGFLQCVEALPAGEQRKANLYMLLEKAKEYESTSYRGLFNFVRYIESLQNYQIDYGEANILSDNENTVKIMSIHKSKGLEFPIVFAAGMGKLFNQQDARSAVVLHPDLGVGSDWVDEALRTRVPTLLKKAVQQKIKKEALGEELRVLYVALTRAKEKLILTGCVSKIEKKLEMLELLKKQEEIPVPYTTMLHGRNYLDWILPALARHKSMTPLYRAYEKNPNPFHSLYENEAGFSIQVISPLTLAIEDAQVQSAQVLKQEELENWNTEVVYDEKMQEELKERFSYQYLPGQIKIPAKVSVSEVKRKQNYVPEGEAETLFDEEIVPYIPSFIKKQEEALTGAGRGTAYHKVFECLDLTDAENEAAIEKQIEKLKDKGRLTAEMAISVDIRDIWKFVQSSLGQRMKEAQKRGELYREQPFVLGINANELVEEYPADETILVQGIIDVFFYEEGEVVLVDYKTDHVYTQKSLISRYKVQMDYYAKALNQLTGLKVKEKYIYSVALQKQIAVI